MNEKSNSPAKDSLDMTVISEIVSKTSINVKTLAQRANGGHKRNLTLNNKIDYHPTTDNAQKQPKEVTRVKYIQESITPIGYHSRNNTGNSNRVFIKTFNGS